MNRKSCPIGHGPFRGPSDKFRALRQTALPPAECETGCSRCTIYRAGNSQVLVQALPHSIEQNGRRKRFPQKVAPGSPDEVCVLACRVWTVATDENDLQRWFLRPNQLGQLVARHALRHDDVGQQQINFSYKRMPSLPPRRDCSAWSVSAPAAGEATAGKNTLKVAPLPTWVDTSTQPSCC